MGDYSGIGDGMVALAVLAAFAVPVAFFAIIALILSLLGFSAAGITVGVGGLIIGIACAVWVTTQS